MNLKSIMLGAAAAAAAVTGAQAADLPVAPEPVDYVRVCDAFGTGFYYIPGTETCLRVFGRVRVDFNFNDYGDAPSNWSQRNLNDTNTRARGYYRMDARTNTEYGLVRAYLDTWVTSDSPHGNASVNLWNAYIQFGNFTFGKAGSFYDYITTSTHSYGAVFDLNSSDKGSQWVAAYTAAFGNGVSASISVEDGSVRSLGVRGTGVSGQAGHRMPDLVANLRVDQGWGSAKIMAALHEVRPLEAAADGKLGWAVGAGVTVNLPMLAAGDKIAFQAAYADGALSYAGGDLGGFRPATWDAAYNGVSTRTAKAWSVIGSFQHNWTPQWQSNIAASYIDVDQFNIGTGLRDWTRWGVVGNLVWKPVSGLQFGVETGYAAYSPSGLADYDEMRTVFRVQRDF